MDTIDPPALAERHERDALSTLAEVRTYPPCDASLHELYAAELVKVARARKLLKADAETVTKPLHQAWKAMLALFNKADVPLEQCELILRNLIGTYELEVKRQAEERQRIADEAARAERERLEAQAAEQAAAGRTEDAALARQAALTLPAAIVADPPKAAGVSMRFDWVAPLISKRSLIEFISTHPEYDELLDYNQANGNGLARSMKDKMRIPGLEARKVPRTVVRTK